MGVIQTSVASLIMPSVITKPQENGAPQVQETSIQAAIAIVEKKVRNLEKRKGKLDSYRDILRRGKALNEDQQSAVDKYDEVIGTLEFTKELMGQFSKLATDEEVVVIEGVSEVGGSELKENLTIRGRTDIVEVLVVASEGDEIERTDEVEPEELIMDIVIRTPQQL